MKKQEIPKNPQAKTGNVVRKKTPPPQTDDSRGAVHPFPIVGIGASDDWLETQTTVPEKRAGEERHGLCHRPAPGPDTQGHHGGAASTLHPQAVTCPSCTGSCTSSNQRRPGVSVCPSTSFFRSLADDLLDKSIGVILSGMGSDGTLGLRAIKEKAGVVFVHEPASAKFNGMPRSAIDAGLADVVAPVEKMNLP